MQANHPFAIPPPHRADTYSPTSSTGGSDWSGMNGHPGALRHDGFRPPPRGDSMTPPDRDGTFDNRPPHRAQTFAADSPTTNDYPDRRGPPEYDSRASSRAGSSRHSDMSLRDPRSNRYQRAEAELRQHYAVLRAYLKGGAAQPPRTQKARAKLLRLSPVQFHELSTDVFDELQRRQAAQPLPGRPPRQDKVPPSLQPRPDFHQKRNQAREKLSSLATDRFRDLSTDVFCELERRFPHFNPDSRRDSMKSTRSTRSMSRGAPGRPSFGQHPGPPPGMPMGGNGFAPPPRTDSAGGHAKNGSMSSNAGFPPRVGSIPGNENNAKNDFGRPMPKQFQSNTITPNKSTMIEDDDDDDDGPLDRYERSSDAFGLESRLTSPRSNRDTTATSMTGGSRDVRSLYPMPDDMHNKIADLEQRLGNKDEEIKELSHERRLKEELQQKLDQAESLNKSMREELERIRQDPSSRASEAAKDGDNEWRQKYRDLESKYEKQLKTTDEVSRQFKSHLAEMRAMADEGSSSMQREEQLHAEVQRLREETAEWKARYTRAKSQLKNVRMSTLGLGIGNANGGKLLRDQTFYATDGLVSDVHVTRFQLAIDELLSSARRPNSTDVLDHIKDLVSAVRNVTGDVEKATTNAKPDEATTKRNKLKSRVSATANNVITASKNYAAAQGLSPVSLLDAAASHLTAAVVDLLQNVKIRSTAPGEDHDDDDDDDQHMTPVNKNGYFDVNNKARRPSGADSVYSALSDPPQADPRTPVAPPAVQSHTNGNGYGLGIDHSQLQQDDVELEELKIYLGNQTDVLVQNIQALVGSVRGESQMPAVRNHANAILDVVEAMLAAAEGGMDQPSSFSTEFTNRVSPSFKSLSKLKTQLENALQNILQQGDKSSAPGLSQSLPPLAFQIAREAKDMTAKAESVMTGALGDAEDFS